MPNIIKHKRNSVAGTVPATGVLDQAELAINIADGKFYTKNSSNVVINLGVTSISGTSITPASGNFTQSLQVNGTGVISSTGGTTNYISKFTGNSTITNSLIFDNGTGVAIGTTTPNANLTVYSTIYGAPSSGNKGAFNIAFGNTNGLSLGTYSTAPYSNYIQSMGIAGTTYPLALNPIGGNVGINTVDPSGKFHIESAVSNNSYILLSNPGNVMKTHIGVGNSDSVPFLASTNNIQLASGTFGWGFFDRATDGFLNIQRRAGGTSWVSVMTMDRSNGNVGIGTTTPSTLLEISKDGGGVDLALVRIVNTNATGGTALKISRTGPQRAAQIIYQSGTTDQFYQGILRDGGSTTNGWSISAGADLNVVAPAIHVTSGNYVGIGTASPSYKLDVAGDAEFGSNNWLKLIDTGGNNGRLAFSAAGSIDAGGTFMFRNNAGSTEHMRITTGGDVGIGITSPSHKLHVSGVIRSTSYINSDTEFRLNNATFSRVATIDGAGAFAGGYNVYLSGSTPKHSTSSPISSYYYYSDGTIRFYTNSSQSADTNASERLRITSAGDVGIGTTTPGYKLQVNGSFAASTKSFRIDHPSKSGWNLEYGSLESPYHGVRLTGRDKVIKGVGVVSLPDYLKDLIHDDDTLNIQITNIKHGKTIYIDKIDLKNDRFIVKADRAKSLGELEFFWTLSGVRKDVDHLVVEKRN